ncbi:cysteine protease [bacterium]|nr:cysteine protease [bacterium]
MCALNRNLPMGWLPDYPDFRDFTLEHEDIAPTAKAIGVNQSDVKGAPSAVDLRASCSPIEHQGSLGSCTANAGVALMEYFEQRAFGRHIDASRLFLYKATRNLLHWTGDTGAFLRTTMGAMVLFGVCPEEYWPYVAAQFDVEPPAFCYSFAKEYQTIRYYRLDSPGIAKDGLLRVIKVLLMHNLPSMFGFTVFSSIYSADDNGRIPLPSPGERHLGGHAVVAVGYDDAMKIANEASGSVTTGAFLIRNSWGVGWGQQGYGWLPYDYVLSGLAIDWWSLMRSDWTNLDPFGVSA